MTTSADDKPAAPETPTARAIRTGTWDTTPPATPVGDDAELVRDLRAVQDSLTSREDRDTLRAAAARLESRAARIAELERERDNLLLGHVWRDKSIGPAFDDLQRKLAAAVERIEALARENAELSATLVLARKSVDAAEKVMRAVDKALAWPTLSGPGWNEYNAARAAYPLRGEG